MAFEKLPDSHPLRNLEGLNAPAPGEDLVSRYLEGDMSDGEESAFETLLSEDVSLQREVEAEQQALDRVITPALRNRLWSGLQRGLGRTEVSSLDRGCRELLRPVEAIAATRSPASHAMKAAKVSARPFTEMPADFAELTEAWHRALAGSDEGRLSFLVALADLEANVWLNLCHRLARREIEWPEADKVPKLLAGWRRALYSQPGEWSNRWPRALAEALSLALEVSGCESIPAELNAEMEGPDSAGEALQTAITAALRCDVPDAANFADANSPRLKGELSVPVVMVDQAGGTQGFLRLYLLADGGGEVRPTVRMAMVPTDEPFALAAQKALDLLKSCGLRLMGFDISWEVRLKDGSPGLYCGSSLTMSLAIGMARLIVFYVPEIGMRRQRYDDLLAAGSFYHFVCSGSLDATQRLEDVEAKVGAILKDPEVTLLLLDASARQTMDSRWGSYRSLHHSGTYLLPRRQGTAERMAVVLCSNIGEMVEAIRVETDIPTVFWDWRTESGRESPTPAELIDREWLSTTIADHHREGELPFLILAGASGVGKSSAMLQYLHSLPGGVTGAPIVHINKSDSTSSRNNPALWLGSLSAQLRRKHRLAAPSLPPQLEAWDANDVHREAQRLAASLAELYARGVVETLFIDGLDKTYKLGGAYANGSAILELVDGLRKLELICSDSQHLDGATDDDLALPAPVGVRMILTTTLDAKAEPATGDLPEASPGDHIHNLIHPRLSMLVPMDLWDPQSLALSPELEEEFVGIAMQRGLNYEQTHGVVSEITNSSPVENFLERIGEACRWKGTNLGTAARTFSERELYRAATRLAGGVKSGPRFKKALANLVDRLGLLASARNPLTLSMLSAMLGEDYTRQTVDCLIGCGGGFVVGDLLTGGDGSLEFSSEGFRAFILDLGRVSPTTLPPSLGDAITALSMANHGRDLSMVWNERLATACREIWRSSAAAAPESVSRYVIRHWLAHLRRSGDWDCFFEVIQDVRFLQSKFTLTPQGVSDFINSANKALAGSPQLPISRGEVASCRRRFLQTYIGILRRCADTFAHDWVLAFQQLYNEIPATLDIDGFRDRLRGALEANLGPQQALFLRTLHEDNQSPSKPRVPIHHAAPVTSVAFSPPLGKGKYSYFVTGGSDRIIQFAQTEKQREPIQFNTAPGVLRTGHDDSPDIRQLAPTNICFVGGTEVMAYSTGTCIRSVVASRIIDAALDPAAAADDVPLAERIKHYATPPATPHSIASSTNPDCTLFAVGCSDWVCRIYDTTSPSLGPVGELLVPVMSEGYPTGGFHRAAVGDTYGCVAMSADGTLVAMGCPDQWVRIWRLQAIPGAARPGGLRLQGELIAELPPCVDRRVDSISFSPDSRQLLVGGGFARGMLEIFDLETCTCSLVAAHGSSIWSIAFLQCPATAKGRRLLLVTGSFDRTFAVWDYAQVLAEAQGAAVERHLPGWSGADITSRAYCAVRAPIRVDPLASRNVQDVVMSIAASADGRKLITAGADYSASVWDVKDGLLGTANPSRHPDAHDTYLNAAAFHPDGKAYATAGPDGKVVLRSSRDSTRITSSTAKAGAAIRAVCIAQCGTRMGLGTEDGAMVMTLDKQMKLSQPETLSTGRAIYAIALPPDPASPVRAVIGTDHGKVSIIYSDPSFNASYSHAGVVRDIEFSADGTWVYSVGDDMQVKAWNLDEQRLIELPQGHRHRVKSIATSPDGRYLATGGRQTVNLWRWAGSAWVLEDQFRGHRDEIWTLAFSPCSRLLASGSKDGITRVWDLQSPAEARRSACLPRTNSILALWFSPDSTRLHIADAGPAAQLPACTQVAIHGL